MQLSLFEQTKERRYLRDKLGRFTTKDKLEMYENARKANYYKMKYEEERRKVEALIDLIKIKTV